MSNGKTIYYIGFYGLQEDKNEEDRFFFISAVRKMDYICEALIEAGYKVNIISPSWVQTNRSYFKTKKVKINENKSVIFTPSFGTKNRILKRLRIYFSYIWLVSWLVFKLKKEDKVIVYHSLLLVKPVLLLRLIKKLHFVLEVEELYCEVTKQPEEMEKLEEKIISRAESFIFSTELLLKKIDVKGRNHLTIYGEYKTIEKRFIKNRDNKIHLVYAGLIDTEITSGAFLALESARYLSNNYVLHILGYGSDSDLILLNKKIEEINKLNKCIVYFNGLMKGRDYEIFMQKMHIGLSTRKLNGNYLGSSFPSKVLSYLSFGLRVVSCYLESISKSKIGDLVNYYYEDNPEEIAKAIINVNLNNNGSTERVSYLHKELVQNLKNLLD